MGVYQLRVGGARAPAAVQNMTPGAWRQAAVPQPATAAEQVPVETQPELPGQEVESQGIDAGVEELQAERDRLKVEPERVEEFRGEVPPHYVDVPRQAADDEDDDEGKDHTGDLLSGCDLSLVAGQSRPGFGWHHVVGPEQYTRHLRVQVADGQHGEDEEDDEMDAPVPLGEERGGGSDILLFMFSVFRDTNCDFFNYLHRHSDGMNILIELSLLVYQ